VAYGKLSVDEIHADLKKWHNEIAPVLPDVDILVYAKNSQLSGSDYASAKYAALKQAGFNIFLTISPNGQPLCQTGESYMLLDRVMVTGSNLKDKRDWFTDLFNAKTVQDPERR
jgi:hypothetical protein